jgi:hypothetical protein
VTEHVYIVTEWSVDYDGWQRGNIVNTILVTSDVDKVWPALGKGQPGWDVYGEGADYGDDFYASSHGDTMHGKRRKATRYVVIP